MFTYLLYSTSFAFVRVPLGIKENLLLVPTLPMPNLSFLQSVVSAVSAYHSATQSLSHLVTKEFYIPLH